MPDPSHLRDSTQIILSQEVFEEVRDEIESEFTVTAVNAEGDVRLIGSPVEIKRVNEFLARHGITIP